MTTAVPVSAIWSALTTVPGMERAFSKSAVNDREKLVSLPMMEVFKQRAAKDARHALGTYRASSPDFCESVVSLSGNEGTSEVPCQSETPHAQRGWSLPP